MHSGADQRRACVARGGAEAGDLARRVLGVQSRWRAQLDRGGIDLVRGGAFVRLHRGEHLGRDRREPASLAIDEQQLLLDPEGERLEVPNACSMPPTRGSNPSAESAAILPNTNAAASPLA